MKATLIAALFLLAACDGSADGSAKVSPAEALPPGFAVPVSGVCYTGAIDKEPRCSCSNSMRPNGTDLWYCDMYPPPAMVFILKINEKVCATHPELGEYCT